MMHLQSDILADNQVMRMDLAATTDRQSAGFSALCNAAGKCDKCDVCEVPDAAYGLPHQLYALGMCTILPGHISA